MNVEGPGSTDIIRHFKGENKTLLAMISCKTNISWGANPADK
jgi:hypothetical protein